MLLKKWFLLFLALGIVGILSFGFYKIIQYKNILGISRKAIPQKPPEQIKTSTGTKIKYSQDFTIVLLGDSMTERLGNSDELKNYLSEYYPNKSFEVLNYGFGSTNILSVLDRLTKTTSHGRDFRPILEIDFNLIAIESFGHNPLSEYPLADGLKKQNETLDKIVKLIRESNSQAKIVFLSTISPNKRQYALNAVDLTPDKRAQWANERTTYLKNHLNYAKIHNIPYVDVFSKSLNSEGDGDIKYIDSLDYIHPSPAGIYLISKELADFIFNQKIL